MHRTASLLVVCLAITCFLAVAQNPQPTTPAAQVRLGNAYLDQKDYSSAMIWFRKAAEQGNASAQNNIGWLYEKGFGVQQDYAEAMTWFLKSANQRNADAENNIGWLYSKGWEVKQDYAEAMTWYRKAAGHGSTRAQQNIGVLYEEGHGVNQDYVEAMTWFRKAADQGNTGAEVNIGWLYEKGWGVKQDYAEAMKWYLGPAQKGDAYAQNNIGVLYEKGLGVDRDYATAMAWYYRAADQGDAQAQNNIGLLYLDGHGDKQDYVKAMTWFRKAADQGLARAQVNVGWLYEKGLGVGQDYAEAMAWYRKAADQGDDDGQNDIGWLYQNGWGVKQDSAEAMTWYRKAVEQGNSRAKANLESLAKLGHPEDQTDQATTSQKDAMVANTPNKGSPPAVMLPNGIRAPRLTYDPEPEYSDEAREGMVTGSLLLQLIVDANGLPRDTKNLVPLGYGLDEKAVAAVKTWKFEPATKDGKPVAVQIMVEVNFRLYEQAGIGEVEIVSDPRGVDLTINFVALNKAGHCGAAGTGKGFSFSVTTKSFSRVQQSAAVAHLETGNQRE